MRGRYFQAANPSSTQRHIYSVPLPSLENADRVAPSSLTDVTSPGYYEASFSPQGAFYLLSYRGPHPPWQRIIHVGHDGTHSCTSYPVEVGFDLTTTTRAHSRL